MKPILLDLFCGAGGCTKGYQEAGFYVIGVDNRPQPRYVGDEFYQADVFEFMAGYDGRYDAIHASPPCQRYSVAQRIQNNDHPDLIEPVRKLLQATGKPYIIENVPGAPLINPIEIAGTMFGLRTFRRRLFECSFLVSFRLIPPCGKHAKMGRLAKPGEYIHVVGRAGRRGVLDQWKQAMQIDWMSCMELSQAIPPAYTRYIGGELRKHLETCEVQL